MFYLTGFLIVLTLAVFFLPAQLVMSQENNDDKSKSKNTENQISISPSPTTSPYPASSPKPLKSPLVNPTPQASSMSSPEASTEANTQPKKPQGQAQSQPPGEIIMVQEPSPTVFPTPTPTPSNIEQPIDNLELLLPMIIQNYTPRPSPSPSPPLSIQLTKRITPPDFGSLFKSGPVEYYSKHGLPIHLSLFLTLISLGMTLLGVFILKNYFSFRGGWSYIRDGEMQKPNESYYSIKKAM